MELNWRTAKSTTAVIAIIICSVLILQGFTVNAGKSGITPLATANPHAVTGHVYWSNDSLEDTIAIPVSITNNRTGETGVTLVDVVNGGNPNGTYQIDLSDSLIYPSGSLSTDIIFVNCTTRICGPRMKQLSVQPHSLCVTFTSWNFSLVLNWLTSVLAVLYLVSIIQSPLIFLGEP